MNLLHRQTLLLIQSQQARNPLPPLMESEDWEDPPTPPPKDARYATATLTNNVVMGRESDSAPASGSKRKRAEHDFDNTVYERRNGLLEAVDRDEDWPTPQKRPRSHAGGRSTISNSDDDSGLAQRRLPGSLRRQRGFGNLSNMNLRHAASSDLHSEISTRESRFQEGSLNDKPSQQPPSVFTRLACTDSGNLQQVDELMNDYHEGMATPRGSTEAYEKATIEFEKATMPARVANITQQRKKEASKHAMFKFNFHPVKLWNKLWSESKEELIARNKLEAERKARDKADIQARYDQMKRDGMFNTQHVPFAGQNRDKFPLTEDAVMKADGYETDNCQRTRSFDMQPLRDNGNVATSEAHGVPEPSEENEGVPTTVTRGRFSHLHFRTPSISNLKDAFKSVRSVRSHSALGAAIGRDSSTSTSVSPAKADLSTLKRSVSKFDLKKERRLSNRVSDLESKLNKARMELKNALDDASPMPRLGSRYERFTPVGTMKRSRFVPGTLAALPSERLLFPEISALNDNSEQQTTFVDSEARTRNTLQLNSGMDMDKAFENIYDEEEQEGEDTLKPTREKVCTTSTIEVLQSTEIDPAMMLPSADDIATVTNTTAHAASQPAQIETMEVLGGSNGQSEELGDLSANSALTGKLGVLEASFKAASKSAKSKKRKSTATIEDEKLYRPTGEAEESELEEAAPKKRKSRGKTTGIGKKKSPGGKVGNKTGIPMPVADSKGKRTKKASKPVHGFFTNGILTEDDGDSADELAPAAPANADSDVPSLEPVYEEEEEVTTVPLKDEPSKPTAKSTPARYGRNAVPVQTIPHKKRSDSLQPAPHLRSADRSPLPRNKSAEVDDGAVVTVPGENGDPMLPVDARDKDWPWPADVF